MSSGLSSGGLTEIRRVKSVVASAGKVDPQCFLGPPGPQGPTGPSGVQQALPTAYYYLSANIPVTGPSNRAIIYNTLAPSESYGTLDCTYNVITGVLKNNKTTAYTILVSGQITTDNSVFDINNDQPSVSIIKTTGTILTSSVINFKGSSFSTSVVLNPGEQLYIQYSYSRTDTINILGGQYSTHITFTQLSGAQGVTGTIGPTGLIGPTGPPAVVKALPSVYYYLSANTPITGPSNTTIIYDTIGPDESQGLLSCTYNPNTGVLSNLSGSALTMLVSGQITTDNAAFDINNDQPSVSIIKTSGTILTSSVINFKGSSFSTSLVLNNGEQLYIRYSYSRTNTINILGGQYTTHITFTQLDNVQGATGAIGPTGPPAVVKALPTVYYYLSANAPITGPSNTTIIYDTIGPDESQGLLNCTYNPSTGILSNPSGSALTILVSGQITTDNAAFDINNDQPSVSIIKTSGTILTSSVINFKGSSFSTSLVLNNGEQLYIRYSYSRTNTINILGGKYTTHITFTQLDNVQGPTGPSGIIGPTGPSAVMKALPTVYYYLSTNAPITGPSNTTIIYDTIGSDESQGSLNCTYNPSTGVLSNPSGSALTMMVSGQITTDNAAFDINNDQPSVSIIKTSGTILTSSVINFKGSSFSTSLVLNNGEQLYIRYSYSRTNTINILGGKYTTHITFTQLDNVQGPTGPSGTVIYSAIVFDGGSAGSSYPFGPAFDCGQSI
jgi:hypothetical protein